MRQKLDISAMRERDLRLLFERCGLSEKIKNGELVCPTCLHVITWETIGGFVVRQGQLVPFCNISECIEAATQRSSNE
jgi:hypothetical protein